MENNKLNKIIIIISIIVIAICIGIIIAMIIVNNTQANSLENEELQRNSLGNVDEYNIMDSIRKPIIYMYPEEEIEISVKLGKPENITCSYPKYEDGWNVKASPDGKLVDLDTGRKLYSLYWEGIHDEPINLEEGFVVKKENIILFLEEKLEILGLNEYEAEEFIIYWLPQLEKNEYNFIRFASIEEINENMPLEFSSKPDTLIRVLMQFKGLDEEIKVKEQNLEKVSRKGFTVVEWGGSEIK